MNTDNEQVQGDRTTGLLLFKAAIILAYCGLVAWLCGD